MNHGVVVGTARYQTDLIMASDAGGGREKAGGRRLTRISLRRNQNVGSHGHAHTRGGGKGGRGAGAGAGAGSPLFYEMPSYDSPRGEYEKEMAEVTVEEKENVGEKSQRSNGLVSLNIHTFNPLADFQGIFTVTPPATRHEAKEDDV